MFGFLIGWGFSVLIGYGHANPNLDSHGKPLAAICQNFSGYYGNPQCEGWKKKHGMPT